MIRNQPPTPPSASAEKVLNSKKKTSQCTSICKLFKDRDYWFLCLSFAFIYSIYTTMGACVGPLAEQFGYKSTATSIFGVVYIFGGLFGSFCHAFVLDKYKKYKVQYLFIGVCCIVIMSVVTATINIGELAIT